MAHWREVKDYEGLYLVSDEGNVLSLPRLVNTKNKSGDIIVNRKAKILKPFFRGRNGLLYPAVALTKDGKTKRFSIHRLVAQAFIPNPNNLLEVNHKDENVLNCNVSNLEWCDHQYNMDYSKSKHVSQYLNGVKVAEYKSIAHASKITGILRQAINNVLTGWSNTAGGYEWRYEDDERSDDLSH